MLNTSLGLGLALSYKLTDPGAGGGGAFDGVLMDTAAGDTFTGRLSYTPTASLTVSNEVVSYSSASPATVILRAKEDDGSVMLQCFDYFELDTTFTITSLPAADAQGFYTGIVKADDSDVFGGELKAHPSSVNQSFQRLYLNTTPVVTAGTVYDWSHPTTLRMQVKREGVQFTAIYTFDNGIATDTLTESMGYGLANRAMPPLLYYPGVVFLSGTHELTDFKFSASFPNAAYAFIGDSLTQGAQATSYADPFPQLIRADHPGQVIVCGAPSATTQYWLGGTRSVIRMQPGHCFVLLGVNDFVTSRSLAAMQADYTTIVERLIAGGITPVCLTLPPINNASVPTFNTWLAAQGWDVVDIYPALLGTGVALNAAYDYGDGIHWNSAGHLVVANLVRAYIAAL